MFIYGEWISWLAIYWTLVQGGKFYYDIIENSYEGQVDYVIEGEWDNCETKEKDN